MGELIWAVAKWYVLLAIVTLVVLVANIIYYTVFGLAASISLFIEWFNE